MSIARQNSLIKELLSGSFKSASAKRYLPLFVHIEEDGDEAGDKNCHNDGNYDDHIQRNTVITCQRR